MRRNRKLSRKKIILGSIAAVLVVATACGVVVAMHRKTPNSGTGQSITLEQSDYEEKKNDSERDASVIYHNGLCGGRGEGTF